MNDLHKKRLSEIITILQYDNIEPEEVQMLIYEAYTLGEDNIKSIVCETLNININE